MVFIAHNSKSDIFFNPIFIPCFSGFMLFRVKVFWGLDFSGSRSFRVQVFQGPGLSGSGFFWVFQGPGFSEPRFFRVRVQVLKVAIKSNFLFNSRIIVEL